MNSSPSSVGAVPRMRPLRARGSRLPGRRPAPNAGLAGELAQAAPDWRAVWDAVQAELLAARYTRATRMTYRQIVRGFARYVGTHPDAQGVTPRHAHGYVEALSARHCSWSWMGTTISALRTVLDKVGGQGATARLRTPRRSHHLPEVLSAEEVARLLAAASNLRDQLLLGLLYGCGLKVGEVRALRWAHVDAAAQTVAVDRAGGRAALPIPPPLLPLLREGAARCAGAEPVVAGRVAGTALSARMIQLIVRQAARDAGLLKPVTAMTLRHSYALHVMEQGATVREVQEALGHARLDTTLRYQRCRPSRAVSPLDRLPSASPPAPPPFALPGVDREALELPFAAAGLPEGEQFRRLVKVRLHSGFLCPRRPSPSRPLRL